MQLLAGLAKFVNPRESMWGSRFLRTVSRSESEIYPDTDGECTSGSV